jgi:hypothetical protein
MSEMNFQPFIYRISKSVRPARAVTLTFRPSHDTDFEWTHFGILQTYNFILSAYIEKLGVRTILFEEKNSDLVVTNEIIPLMPLTIPQRLDCQSDIVLKIVNLPHGRKWNRIVFTFSGHKLYKTGKQVAAR